MTAGARYFQSQNVFESDGRIKTPFHQHEFHGSLLPLHDAHMPPTEPGWIAARLSCDFRHPSRNPSLHIAAVQHAPLLFRWAAPESWLTATLLLRVRGPLRNCLVRCHRMQRATTHRPDGVWHRPLSTTQ